MNRRALLFVLLAACGARTGFLSEPPADLDASTPGPDASRDAVVDVRSSPDALPVIDASVRDVTPISDCTDAAKLYIYLLSDDNDLLRFDPASITMKTIGKVACPTFYTPNSMAIDRRGVAYAGFTDRTVVGVSRWDGQIFTISTSTAECSATPYVAQRGFAKFGMGFSGDGKGGETLFLADTTTDPKGALASVDLTTFGLGYVGSFSSPLPRCELTGTGDGRLFAFCMNSPSGSTLAEIDPATARVVSADRLTAGGDTRAFAFAHWGGFFWLFTGSDTSTITRYDPALKSETIVGNADSLVVGAGVSACVPL